jgi:hypothetical protein
MYYYYVFINFNELIWFHNSPLFSDEANIFSEEANVIVNKRLKS